MLSQLSVGLGGCQPVCMHIATEPMPKDDGNYSANIKVGVGVKLNADL